MILKTILKKIKNAWQKFKLSLRNEAWTGIGGLFTILGVFITIIIFAIEKNPPLSETPISTTPSPLVSALPTEETPFVTEQPITETPVVPTKALISPTQEEPAKETPTTVVPTESVSLSCLSNLWKPYPNTFSTLVMVDNDGCQNFKEMRFTLNDKTLEMYVNPISDTNVMGIYTTLPEGEWHKTFEIQVVQFPSYDDGRRNRFFIGFINSLDSKFKGKFLEIYSREPKYVLGRLFAGEPIERHILIGSKIVVECEITDLHKTTCSITIDESPEQVFENVLTDDQSTNAFFIGYSVFKESTLEITVTDKSEETIFQ